jgi:hypothetical protein
MADLIQNRYHLFNVEKSAVTGYYPKQLLAIIREMARFDRSFPIENGAIYTARAFFAISAPIDGEIEYQSGYLDLKLLLQENENYIGEVLTALPPQFVLKKGSKIKLQKSNILYKTDYSSSRKK